MGIWGALGKMAGSKVIEKVESELTKKQNREQTSGYCNYIKSNLVRICNQIAELENATKALIGEVTALKGVKLSFKEKGAFRKTKEKTENNLKYLYLARDFFTALAKNASGLILSNEELDLVIKFAPFFDGVPVLDIYEDDDSDDSVLGAFKEVGQELKEAFISSKKGSKKFDFDEYLYRYDEKIDDFVMPDVNSAIENFKNTMAMQEAPATPTVPVTVPIPEPAAPPVTTPTTVEEIECPNCGTKLGANSKFCLECGCKIEIKKSAFCIECGEPLAPGAKFCASCGTKVN